MTKADQRRISNDPFGVHEALHSAYIVQSMFEEFVREHPVVVLRPDIAAKAETASAALADVYQALGVL